jgi:hypothetical protein
VKALTPSVQAPPFAQGAGAHSSTSVAHVSPENPGAHAQVKPLTRSVHVPPLRQGSEAQSSTSVAHVAPE